jgi:hypothetical protein
MKSRLAGLVSAAALALGIGAVGFTQMASAGVGPQEGLAPLTIVKTVSGPVPAGTTFTATVDCGGDHIIFVQGDDPTDTATVTFDSTGQPTSPDIVTFVDGGQCTVTETASGGATTTRYACEGSIPEPPSTTTTTEAVPKSEGGVFPSAVLPDDPICTAAGPQAAPIAVNIEDEDQEATVTIANTFAAAQPIQPAAQVVAQPTFTG